jgi:hypothetical protein
MWKYIVAHWRGEQGLLKSCLLNGVVGYLILACTYMGVFFTVVFATANRWSSDDPGRVYDHSWTVISLIYMLWACVGIIRCGSRYLLEPGADRTRRIQGIVGITWAAAIAVYTIAKIEVASHGYF